MTLPATDGILEKLQALLAYDASSPLIFSSGLFLFLFAGFMLIYNAFRRAPMARIVYVILFSLYFYYKSSGIYFLLLIFARLKIIQEIFLIVRQQETAAAHDVHAAERNAGMNTL